MAYRYDPATRPCSGYTMPGTAALERAIGDLWPGAFIGGPYGTYNCRLVSGGSSPSVHGNGRAGDVGFANGPTADGRRLYRFLIDHAEQLGIQTVIYAGWIWGAGRPVERVYTGSSKHLDHVHWEQIVAASKTLTYVAQARVIHDFLHPPTPASKAPTTPEDDVQILLRPKGGTAVWITNGLHRRHVGGGDDLDVAKALAGFRPVLDVDPATLAHIPIVGAVGDKSLPNYDASL